MGKDCIENRLGHKGASCMKSTTTILSPIGAVWISILIAAGAIIFPPNLYEAIMQEPSYMFLNPTTSAFVLLCISAFFLGTKLIKNNKKASPNQVRIKLKKIPVIILIAISCAGLIVNIASLYTQNPDILDIILTNEGWKIKQGTELDQSFALMNPFGMGVLWLWIYIGQQTKAFTSRPLRVIWQVGGLSLATLILLSSTLRLARGEIIPIIVGSAIAYASGRSTGLQARGFAPSKVLLRAAILCILIFAALSVVRGIESINSIPSDIVGYTLSSFNRLSLLLEGDISPIYRYRLAYFSGFLSFNNSFNSLVPFAEVFDIPDYMTLWESEFTTISVKGLNPYLIWTTAYGYAYVDIGWLAPFYFLTFGLLTQMLWKGLCNDNPIGIVLYPWAFFSALFWFGTNYLLDTKFFVLLFVATSYSIANRSLSKPQITVA